MPDSRWHLSNPKVTERSIDKSIKSWAQKAAQELISEDILLDIKRLTKGTDADKESLGDDEWTADPTTTIEGSSAQTFSDIRKLIAETSVSGKHAMILLSVVQDVLFGGGAPKVTPERLMEDFPDLEDGEADALYEALIALIQTYLKPDNGGSSKDGHDDQR